MSIFFGVFVLFILLGWLLFIVFIVYGVVSLFIILFYGIDKLVVKKEKWWVLEVKLYILSLLGGWFGVLLV